MDDTVTVLASCYDDQTRWDVTLLAGPRRLIMRDVPDELVGMARAELCELAAVSRVAPRDPATGAVLRSRLRWRTSPSLRTVLGEAQ